MSHSREVRCLDDGRLLGWAVKSEFPASGLTAVLPLQGGGEAAYPWGARSTTFHNRPDDGEFVMHVNVPSLRIFELDHVVGFIPYKTPEVQC